jgi:hypothetical protein
MSEKTATAILVNGFTGDLPIGRQGLVDGGYSEGTSSRVTRLPLGVGSVERSRMRLAAIAAWTMLVWRIEPRDFVLDPAAQTTASHLGPPMRERRLTLEVTGAPDSRE